MTELDGQEPTSAGSLPDDVLRRLHHFPGQMGWADVINELNEQTHRGLAVLGTALLEWKLRESIKTQLLVEDEIGDRLFGTPDSTGGLGFKNSAQLAYCMGLVGRVALDDLERIGEVRNKFAHRLFVRDFDSDKVRELCLQLKTLDAVTVLAPDLATLDASMKDHPRNRFLITIHFLGSLISRSAHHILQQQLQSPKPSLLKDWFW